MPGDKGPIRFTGRLLSPPAIGARPAIASTFLVRVLVLAEGDCPCQTLEYRINLEVSSRDGTPARLQEGLPGYSLSANWCRLNAFLQQDALDGVATDLAVEIGVPSVLVG